MEQLTIDLNRLTYREYQAYLAGDRDEIDMLTTVVTAWQFEGNPSERTSYDALGIVDLIAVQQALREAIQSLMSAEGNSDAPSL